MCDNCKWYGSNLNINGKFCEFYELYIDQIPVPETCKGYEKK